MKIRKMTATFGALDHAVLEPGDGLTIVSAPNEAGKSTWAGFLRAMLYGIDTKERDKAGFLADKTRYQPWSGAPMSGELQLEWQGKDITLRRFSTRTGPFGGFEAVYTGSGDPVPGLTAANAGEKLTGVSREVYQRSAFVGQGSAAIGASGELEARVSALATSGQEDVSYSAVERTLKDWRNRRRANRSSGLIPRLEEELSELDAVRRAQEHTCRRTGELQQELARLQESRRELRNDLNTWERIERHELNRRYGEAYLEWEEARAAVPEDKPHPVFGSMTGEEAWDFAQKKQRERDAALEENRRREEKRETLEKTVCEQRMTVRLEICVAVLALLIGIGLVLWSKSWAPLFGLGGIATAALIMSAVSLRRVKLNQQALAGLGPVTIPAGRDWLGQAAEYQRALIRAEQAKAEEAAARRRVEDLSAQGGQLADTLELLHTPAQSKAATAARLSAVERELERCREELARSEGALAQLGGGEDAQERRTELEGQLARRLEEYDALTAALDALAAANAALRERFSPALNREAGEIFAVLTGGRWPRLSLARDFTAQAIGEGDAMPRSWLALSAGTAEQLYLSVRLAICALTAPDAPLVLDDALAAFDDGRCARALDYLKEAARGRQILLFSCHGREADWAEAHNVPVVRIGASALSRCEPGWSQKS